MDPQRPEDDLGHAELDTATLYNAAPSVYMHDYHALGSQLHGPRETNMTNTGHGSEKTEQNMVDPLLKGGWDRRNPLRDWSYEMLGMMVAIGLLIAITMILRQFEDKEQPKWPHELTLNSVIAILSTILRALLASIVAQGMFRGKEKRDAVHKCGG
ncbi:hypothetical protein F5B18DRAFT_92053 [Nemania serpens]|nr:hypothetical protein F5B18DRAFT_92053 [Nemania serpens]